MPRTKLKDRELPEYTKGEEIFNMVSHIVGGAFSIVATIICLIVSTLHSNGLGIASSIVYGFSIIFLYTMSSIYHGLSSKKMAKRVFQVLDHCSIFLMIAGCYTPILLCGIMKESPVAAWVIFGIVWLMAILGITLNAIDLKKYKVFSMVCYLVMGWSIIFKINILYEVLGLSGFLLMIAGGLSYTIGALLYGLNKKKHVKYMHSIFHLFVLLASILQFLAIIKIL